MAALDPAAFSAADPQAFYLLEARADWEALSDATLVVQGARLPVHSQVLSLQSGVLRGLFAEFLGGLSSSPHVGCKRPAGSQEGLVLQEPFGVCSLFEAALFLRLAYQPEQHTTANLAAVRGSLPALLRMAHRLDARQILRAVSDFMLGQVDSGTSGELLEWIAAAEACQFPALALRCTVQLARRLAGGAGPLPGAMAEVGQLAERCDKATLSQLLALVVAAGGSQLGNKVASPEEAEWAMEAAARQGSFEWALDRVSQQAARTGQGIASHWFRAAGRLWRFKVYLNGSSADAAGHLSVYLQAGCTAAFRAQFSVTAVEQGSQGAAHGQLRQPGFMSEVREFSPSRRWGWPKFMSLADLRSRPGYLAGDRLVLRARVEVAS